MPLTQELGRFVAELSFDRLPAEAVEVARTGFTDCIATMIAGAQDPAPQLLRRALAPTGGEASLYFSGERAPAPEAAWINGTAGHALDYDDVASLRGHPSTVMVPAILAEGETLGASGRDMLAAYVAGYETWAELARRDPGHHHRKGWHPTGIFGPIGAAAACAVLRRLDATRATHALALAASHSGGVMANFGTMTKPFHAGTQIPPAAVRVFFAFQLSRCRFAFARSTPPPGADVPDLSPKDGSRCMPAAALPDSTGEFPRRCSGRGGAASILRRRSAPRSHWPASPLRSAPLVSDRMAYG